MQRITYVNLLGETAVLSAQKPYVLHSVTGTGTTEATVSAVQGAYQHGETIRGLLRGVRHVDCLVSIWGATRAAMYDARRALAGVLAAQKGYDESSGETGRLYYECDGGKWWTEAVPEGGVQDMATRHGNYQADVPLSFRCPSAWWHAMEVSSVTYDFSGTGLTLPFELPFQLASVEYVRELRNRGQVNAPVTITVEGHGETPALLNEDTGATIALTSPLPYGATLEINTDPSALSCRITDAEGTRNAFGLLDPSGAVTDFVLRPGLNHVRYVPTGDAVGSIITIRWRGHFEGV